MTVKVRATLTPKGLEAWTFSEWDDFENEVKELASVPEWPHRPKPFEVTLEANNEWLAGRLWSEFASSMESSTVGQDISIHGLQIDRGNGWEVPE